MSNNFLINRKAQIGETMTWVVATIIIITILLGFIYASSLFAKTKNLSLPDSKISLSKSSDVIYSKNLFAYEKTSMEQKPVIKIWIENETKIE